MAALGRFSRSQMPRDVNGWADRAAITSSRTSSKGNRPRRVTWITWLPYSERTGGWISPTGPSQAAVSKASTKLPRGTQPRSPPSTAEPGSLDRVRASSTKSAPARSSATTASASSGRSNRMWRTQVRS